MFKFYVSFVSSHDGGRQTFDNFIIELNNSDIGIDEINIINNYMRGRNWGHNHTILMILPLANRG